MAAAPTDTSSSTVEATTEPKPQVLIANKRLSHLGLHNHFSNSTSSLYVADVISRPNVPHLIKCVAVSLHELMQLTEGSSGPSLFDEELHPISHVTAYSGADPSADDIELFISRVFKCANVSSECAVICWIYLERIVTKAKVRLQARNWRRLLLSSIILASKAWEDLAVWNVDFTSVADAVNVKDLNALEIEVLMVLEFSVTVHASTYADMYFRLRDKVAHDQPHEEIDMSLAERLEITSSRHESEHRNVHDKQASLTSKRSLSTGDMLASSSHHTKVVIS